MDWQLKENVRLGKTCEVCVYGTHLTGDPSVGLCDWNMEHEGWDHPELAPRIKTCLKFEDETKP